MNIMGKFEVYVRKIPRSSTASELVEVLERAVGKGTLSKADIRTDSRTCASRGFGFVSFNTFEAAERAVMLGMNGRLILLNNQLQVDFADRDILKRPRHSMTTWEDVLFLL